MISLPITPISKFSNFASREFPLRGSKLDTLARCPGSYALEWLAGSDDVNVLGGAAAQTGNLLHHGVAEFHKNDNREEVGRAAIEQIREKFPDGDAEKAIKIFDAYVADPENQVVVPHVEISVTAEFENLPDDPTGNPVVIRGTVDQIRRGSDGQLYVWDIKTGSRLSLYETLDHHMYQLSGYSVAATQTLGETVHPGGIIYTEGYLKTRSRSRIHCTWYYEDALRMMRTIRQHVTSIRKGEISIVPSQENCKYCVHKNIHSCIPTYRSLLHGNSH